VKPSLQRTQIVSTVALLALTTVSCVLGLLRPGHYTDHPALLPRLFAQDLVILVVAVPVLAIGLWSASRGSLRGRILWLGGLAYMTYIWASVSGQVAFNQFFLGYVALLGLSLFTLVSGLATTDADAVARRLDGRVSRRTYSAFLALVAGVLAVMWLSDVAAESLAGTTPLIIEELGPRAVYTHVLDLGVVVPAMVIAATWLRDGRPWGYTAAGVLLVFGAVLGPGITAVMVVDLLGGAVSVTLPLLAGSVLPPALSALFAVRFLFAMGGRTATGAPSDDGAPA
jgi:hypothetical protein